MTFDQVSLTLKEYWGHPATLIKRLNAIEIEGYLLQLSQPNLSLHVQSSFAPQKVSTPPKTTPKSVPVTPSLLPSPSSPSSPSN